MKLASNYSLKGFTLKFILIACLTVSQFATIPKSEAYWTVSIMMGDIEGPGVDKTACAVFFVLCIPFLILGDEVKDSSLSLEKLLSINERWLEETFEENDKSIIVSDMKKLKQAVSADSEKTFMITSEDNFDSLFEIFNHYNVPVSDITIDAIIDSYFLRTSH